MKAELSGDRIAAVVQGTSFLLLPDDARKLIQQLQAALSVLEQQARKQEREARAAALWARWLAEGAVEDTRGGLSLWTPVGCRWLRAGCTEDEAPPANLRFARPVWSRWTPAGVAHLHHKPGLPACGLGSSWRAVVDPAAEGVRLCKLCAKAFGGAA